MVRPIITILIINNYVAVKNMLNHLDIHREMTRNDTLIDQNTSINLSEIDKKRISIQSQYFNTYLTDIDKQRYFASVSYYSTDITGSLEMEVYDDGLIVLLHTDEDQDSFVFTGSKN